MRFTPLLILVSAVVLGWSLPAQAHTALVSSDPADGARLDAAPNQVVLTFSEELKEPVEAVVAVDGDQQEWSAAVDGAHLVITPARTPAEGAYTIDYRVVSADGHPVTGALSFTVGESAAASGDTTTTPASGSDADEGSVWASPWFLGILGVLAIGVLGGAVAVWRGRSGSAAGR